MPTESAPGPSESTAAAASTASPARTASRLARTAARLTACRSGLIRCLRMCGRGLRMCGRGFAAMRHLRARVRFQRPSAPFLQRPSAPFLPRPSAPWLARRWKLAVALAAVLPLAVAVGAAFRNLQHPVPCALPVVQLGPATLLSELEVSEVAPVAVTAEMPQLITPDASAAGQVTHAIHNAGTSPAAEDAGVVPVELRAPTASPRGAWLTGTIESDDAE